MKPCTPARLAAIIALALVALLLAACGTSPKPPYRTLPPPPLNHQQPPSHACPHTMGACLPQPATTTASFTALERASRPSVTVGPDLSNNDPVKAPAGWRLIGAYSRFAYLKSVEGTRFTDSTAAVMSAYAHQARVPAGGYDFLHICLVPAAAEAGHFVASLHAQHLLGPGTLPPAGDAEYPFPTLTCSGRVWIQTWVDVVYSQDGHVCPILYTGAWWYQPHIGAWWPTCGNRQLLAWVSGYGVAYPYMPAGVSHLDLWQFSDHGFNGYGTSDTSIWRSTIPFATFARQPTAPPAGAYEIFPATRFRLARGQVASERYTVQTWDRNRCRNPVRRPVCISSRAHLVALRDREWFVAHHQPPRWKPASTPRWGAAHLGARFQGISRRLHQTT